MSLRRRVAGVDFSGARDAGRHIWIAEGETTCAGIRIDRLTRADGLPHGAVAFAPALSALVEHVAALDDAVVGFDFPFSLPKLLVRQRTWASFARHFALTYGEPSAFREACRAATDGKELKRRADTDARVPWCAYNLRLHRQAWAGIAHVLWPLARDDRARIIPMHEIVPGKPVVAEICPASLLKREALYFPYKGKGDGLRPPAVCGGSCSTIRAATRSTPCSRRWVPPASTIPCPATTSTGSRRGSTFDRKAGQRAARRREPCGAPPRGRAAP